MSQSGKDWEWRLGYLNGVGECCWQALGGNIRRISRFVAMPQGGAVILKGLPCIASTDPEPKFSSESMVVASTQPKQELIDELERAWEGGVIIPMAGARVGQQ